MAAQGRAGLRFPALTGVLPQVALNNRLCGAPVTTFSARSELSSHLIVV